MIELTQKQRYLLDLALRGTVVVRSRNEAARKLVKLGLIKKVGSEHDGESLYDATELGRQWNLEQSFKRLWEVIDR